MFKKILVTVFAVLSFAAQAQVTQSAGGAGNNFDSYSSWPTGNLGSVLLASGTNAITSLTGSAIAYDQGWGGECAACNHVQIDLFINGTSLWSSLLAGGGRGTTSVQSFDAMSDASSFSLLNSVLASIDWSSAPTVSLTMTAVPYGYPGWELHVQDAQFSVTSVPEPSTYAMLLAGLGMLGFMARRKTA
jgi:hypothetical protein